MFILIQEDARVSQQELDAANAVRLLCWKKSNISGSLRYVVLLQYPRSATRVLCAGILPFPVGHSPLVVLVFSQRLNHKQKRWFQSR